MQHAISVGNRLNTSSKSIKRLHYFCGIFSVVLYIFSNLSNHISVSFIFEYFFAIAFFIGIFFRPWQLKNDIFVRLIGLSLAIPIISFFINYYLTPLEAKQYFLIENLFRIMAFSAVGYWLGGRLINIHIFLTLVLLSSLIAIFNVDIFQNFSNLFNGERVSSGIGNSQYTASLFGLIIIGMICFFCDFLSYALPKKLFIAYLTLYLSTLSLCIIVLIGSQTRAAIIAMDVIYVVSLFHIIYYLKFKSVSKKAKKLFFTYVLISFFVLSSSTYNTIEKRSDNDKAVIENIAAKGFENIAMSSLGVRINSWIEVSEWIKEKPIHGWGGKANSYVFKYSNFPENIKKFGHFHNSYIDFILSYGFSGLALIFFTFYWLNKQAYIFSKENEKYIGVWIFTLYGTIFMSFINFFESYLFYSIGVYTTAVLLSPAYSVYLSKLRKKFT